jgi:hypothetical protein
MAHDMCKVFGGDSDINVMVWARGTEKTGTIRGRVWGCLGL